DRLNRLRRGYWHEHAGYFADQGFISADQWETIVEAYGCPEPKGIGDTSITVWPLPNLHVGTSIENQKTADERIPHLLAAPAKVRFLSAEPLLGPIEFSSVTKRSDAVFQLGKKSLSGIDWVIVGGESGP